MIQHAQVSELAVSGGCTRQHAIALGFRAPLYLPLWPPSGFAHLSQKRNSFRGWILLLKQCACGKHSSVVSAPELLWLYPTYCVSLCLLSLQHWPFLDLTMWKSKHLVFLVYHLLCQGLQLTLVNWILKSARTGWNCGGARIIEMLQLGPWKMGLGMIDEMQMTILSGWEILVNESKSKNSNSSVSCGTNSRFWLNLNSSVSPNTNSSCNFSFAVD